MILKAIQSERIAGAFLLIFWGQLMAMVDVRIGSPGIDLLPDLLGWGLTLVASRMLLPVGPNAWRASYTAVGGLVAATALTLSTLSGGVSPQMHAALMWIELAVSLIFIWQICGVIIDLASELDDFSMRQTASRVRWICVGVFAAITLIRFTEGANALMPIVIVLILIQLAALLVFLSLMLKVARRARTGPPVTPGAMSW